MIQDLLVLKRTFSWKIQSLNPITTATTITVNAMTAAAGTVASVVNVISSS